MQTRTERWRSNLSIKTNIGGEPQEELTPKFPTQEEIDKDMPSEAKKGSVVKDLEDHRDSSMLDHKQGCIHLSHFSVRLRAMWERIFGEEVADNVTANTANIVTNTANIGVLELKHNLLHIRDEKAQNTPGGTFTLGAWRTRDLNTVKTNEITEVSLASNQITLPAGTYWIEASAPAFMVNQHQIKVYDITNTADLIIGASQYASVTGVVLNRSFCEGRITLAGITVIELQHRCATTRVPDGLGTPSNFTTEVYSEIIIRQVS